MFHGMLGASLLAFVAGTFVWLGKRDRAVPRRVWLADLACVAALVPVALLSMAPYVGRNLVGSGDSQHYALQVADFITQSRAGILPVWVGQTDFAFNGNVHTLRTAPYFTHLAGLLDALSGRQLSPVVLQNLTVVATSLLAGLAAYLAARFASGGKRIASLLLATIYLWSPGVAGPLALNDMFATYMTAPWTILVWAGIAGILAGKDDLLPQLIAAAALAVTWYAHPPVAGWLSLVWGTAQLCRAGLAGAEGRQWARFALAGAVFAALAAHAFAAFGTLPPGIFDASTPSLEFSRERLDQVLIEQFAPFALPGSKATIQLGWTICLLAGIGAAVLASKRPPGALLFLGLLGCLTLLLFPVPGLGPSLWALVPHRLVATTTWPAQRLVPLLAGGIIVAAGLALARVPEWRPSAYRWACAVLAAGALWSLAEMRTLHRRLWMEQAKPADYASRFLPENVVLTRYSYALAARLPGYFTNSWTEPEFETRVLNRDLDVMVDNASIVLALAAPTSLRSLGSRQTIDLPGPGDYLFEFAFSDPAAAGELTFESRGLYRHYALPRSGEPLAFGSGPEAAKTIPLRVNNPGSIALTIRCSAPGVSFRVLPFSRDQLPIRVPTQAPLRIHVNPPSPGFVETARIFLPGYRARVNNVDQPVRVSPNGLVMVPVPAGPAEVVIDYPGLPSLRFTWALSLGALAGLPWLLAWASRRTAAATRLGTGEPDRSLVGLLRREWSGRRIRLAVFACGVMALPFLVLALRRAWHGWQSYDSIRLEVEFPKRPASRAEPLLTLGRTGAAHCLYVVHEDAHHIRLALDQWGRGGPVSEPIPIHHSERYQLEIALPGLYPFPAGRLDKNPAPEGMFEVRLAGRTIFRTPAPRHVAAADEVKTGENHVGSSVTAAHFSGWITVVERFRQSDRRP